MAPLGEGSIDTIKPDTASVEFGVQVAVKSGNLTGLLVGGSGEASSKVIWAGELGQPMAPTPAKAQGPRGRALACRSPVLRPC